MSAKLGLLSIACVQLGLQKLSVIRSSRVSSIQGLRIEVNGRAVGTFRIVQYRGCPLFRGVRYAGFHCKFEVPTKHSTQLLVTSISICCFSAEQ